LNLADLFAGSFGALKIPHHIRDRQDSATKMNGEKSAQNESAQDANIGGSAHLKRQSETNYRRGKNRLPTGTQKMRLPYS